MYPSEDRSASVILEIQTTLATDMLDQRSPRATYELVTVHFNSELPNYGDSALNSEPAAFARVCTA
jgi:hypothetical protein